MKKIVREFKNIEPQTREEKMYYSYKPKRSKSNQCIGKERTLMVLKCFPQKIGRCENDKYACVHRKRYGKSAQHRISMYKNIGIDNCIQEYEDRKIEKEHRMTHKKISVKNNTKYKNTKCRRSRRRRGRIYFKKWI